jgi:hypothetical protein
MKQVRSTICVHLYQSNIQSNFSPVPSQYKHHRLKIQRQLHCVTIIFRQELGYVPVPGFTRNYTEPGYVTEKIFLSRFGDDVTEYRSMTPEPVRSEVIGNLEGEGSLCTFGYISDVSEGVSEVQEVCLVMIEQSNLHQ